MATRGMRHVVLWVTDPTTRADLYQQARGLQIKSTNGDVISRGA